MSAIDWRQLPSLSSLRAFEAAARLGGFSQAARALNVTHAAVAQQVRGLEAELATVLARREGRGLALTSEGQRLAAALSEGFGVLAGGVDEVRRSRNRPGVHITTTVVMGQTVVMPRLSRFWLRHPDIRVSVTPTQAVADLVRDGYDCAIRSGAGGWPGVEARHLYRSRTVVAGAPSLMTSAPDLSALPWIADPNDPQDREWLIAGGLDPDRVTVRGIDNPVLSVAAAIAGNGLLFSTDVVLADAIAAGQLVLFPYPELPDADYWLVTPSGPLRPAVRTFVDWLVEELGSQ